MDLSNVPTEVLEQVKNKWKKVFSRHDINNESCAMCKYTGSGRPGFTGYCGCPIEDECEELLNDAGLVPWVDLRNRFLADIKAEINGREKKL
jgi:hypothetical protein